MSYCEEDDVKGEGDKALAIKVAEGIVNKETGDNFSRKDVNVVKLFDGDGTLQVLVTPYLINLTKVEVKIDSDSWEEYLLDGLRWGPGYVMIDSEWRQPYRRWRRTLASECYQLGRSVFPRGTKNIKLTGDWGWESVPDVIRQATAFIASNLLASNKIETSERLGDYSVNYGSKSSRELVTKLVEYYRLHKIIGVLV